jgi:hypothetical protein
MLHGEFLQRRMIIANEKIGCKSSYKIFGETCYSTGERTEAKFLVPDWGI